MEERQRERDGKDNEEREREWKRDGKDNKERDREKKKIKYNSIEY